MIYTNSVYQLDTNSVHSAVDECFKHNRFSVLVVVLDGKAFRQFVNEIVKYATENYHSTNYKYGDTLGLFVFTNGSCIRIMREPISARGVRVNRILIDERVSAHTLYTVLMPLLREYE